VEARLRASNVDVSTWITEGPGHATALARRAVGEGFGTLVAVGGDGTVHEVVNGFEVSGRPRDDVRLGIVPSGTGMDLARNLRLASGPGAAAERILAGRERMIDVGVAQPNNVLFVNFAETGLGAAVVARRAEFPPRLPGRISFLAAAVQAALAEDNVGVRILVDDRLLFEGAAVSTVTANGAYFGAGMKIAPSASMQDGRLDVVVLGDFTRLEMVTQIWKLYPGVHIYLPKVTMARGTTVRIEAFGPTRLDLDGELVESRQPYVLSVLPAALRVLV
jgi:YegS/Rv2252/BmrU family lipid kinase